MAADNATSARRSSLASRQRMSLHLQRLAETDTVAPERLKEKEPRTTTTGSAAGSMLSKSGGSLIPQTKRSTTSVTRLNAEQTEKVDPICLEDAGPTIEVTGEFHRTMSQLATSAVFNGFVLFIVIVNSLQLILLTYTYITLAAGWYFSLFDAIYLAVYICEAVIKIYVYRRGYFKDPWTLLDFIIMVLSVIDFVLTLVSTAYAKISAINVVRIIRIFRVVRGLREIRILRSIRLVGQLQAMMVTILRSLRPLGVTSLIMLFLMYLFAVVGEGLFGDVDYRFANLWRSWWTMFLLLTSDDWFYMIIAIEYKDRQLIFVFVIIYQVILVLIFVSIFLSVVVDSFSVTLARLKEERRAKAKCLKSRDDDKDDALLLELEDSESEDDDQVIDDSCGTIDGYYVEVDSSRQELRMLRKHLQLMAAIDCQLYQLSENQRILDAMSDMAADVSMNSV